MILFVTDERFFAAVGEDPVPVTDCSHESQDLRFLSRVPECSDARVVYAACANDTDDENVPNATVSNPWHATTCDGGFGGRLPEEQGKADKGNPAAAVADPDSAADRMGAAAGRDSPAERSGTSGRQSFRCNNAEADGGKDYYGQAIHYIHNKDSIQVSEGRTTSPPLTLTPVTPLTLKSGEFIYMKCEAGALFLLRTRRLR